MTHASASVTDSSDHISTATLISKQTQEMIRNFDGYEKELWFESNLPYSASDEAHLNVNNKYKADYTYPKVLGLPLATTHDSASLWYTEMSAITSDYDSNNPNKLTENLPDYLWDDPDSVDFLTFTDLLGHHFDNIKIYIKNLENLSSRYPKVDKEISSMELSKFRKSINVDWDIKVWVSEGPDTCVAEMIGIDDEGFDWVGVGIFNVVKETDASVDVIFNSTTESICSEDDMSFTFNQLMKCVR